MKTRTEDLYLLVIDEIKTLKNEINPSTIMTDFERATINAISLSFPNSKNRECLFHVKKSIHKHLQQCEGLQQKYANESEFALEMKKLAFLAFVPENDIIAAFEALGKSQYFKENEDLIQSLLHYFEDTWIGRIRAKQNRTRPMFALNLWNCFECAINDLPKSNKSVEGWHNSFPSLLGANEYYEQFHAKNQVYCIQRF